MAMTNPFPDDPDKAEVFEQGYVAGFMDPDSSDFRPLAPELLPIFQQGFQAGRGDKSNSPPVDASLRWMDKSQVSELGANSTAEDLEPIATLALTLLLDHIFETAKFSLVDIAELALSPGGDTRLEPLPPDFRAGFNVESTDSAVHFIAVCPRSDYTQTSPGVTSDGNWTGQDRSTFADAFNDLAAHGHPEALVARCDFNDNTCGAVWLATQK